MNLPIHPEEPYPGPAGGPTNPEVPVPAALAGPPVAERNAAPVPPPPRRSKAGAVLGAIRVGYVYQALVLVSGLWLARFLLGRLGDHDYGLWAVGAQIVAWMYLMDLGVVALLPRDTAYVLGAMPEGVERDAAVRRVIDRTLSLVLWQVPIVAVITVCVWLLLPARWEPLVGPLLVIFATFVVGFPFRVFQAALQGLQDLVYISIHTVIGWALGLVVTVSLVLLGMRLYGLAAGWVVVQAYQYLSAWHRLRTRHRAVLPSRLTPLKWAEARILLMSGTWLSVSQVAQVLVAGTDVLIVGWILGPLAVTSYTITAKLVTALANQPQLIMQVALPGVSEIRAGADMARLHRVATALSQAMLIASGLVFCTVMVANEPFVALWLPDDNPYAGNIVTGLLLLVMLLRHWNFTAVYTLFALGGEKRISLTTLADGAVTVLVTLFAVRRFGMVGAPLGALAGVVLVSLPANLVGVARAADVSVGTWLRPLVGWMWRFVVLAALAVWITWLDLPTGIVALGFTVAFMGVISLLVMSQVALSAPLGSYVRHRVPWLSQR